MVEWKDRYCESELDISTDSELLVACRWEAIIDRAFSWGLALMQVYGGIWNIWHKFTTPSIQINKVHTHFEI